MYGASKLKKKEIIRDQTWQRGKALARILWKKFVPLFSLLFRSALLCLMLPKSEISTFLFNAEINFHPVTLNLIRRKAALLFLSL